MATVRFERVQKQYGNGEPVIADLTLHIADREFLVLVGPSGCGKSTALRMIAGLEDVTGGTLSIDGHVVNDLPPKARDVAMVFQNYALYPHMTCRANMGFALKLARVNKAEIARRVDEAAKILEIDHLLDRKPRQLSGGQRQRVAIGRAIVREPKVFLMDEPLSNLDAKLRVTMRAEIKRLHQRLRTTFVYVTHDQTEAMTLGTRIAIMNGGALQQCDTPANVYRRPANLFVATFVGSPPMNLLHGDLRGAGNESIVEGRGFRFVVPIDGRRHEGPVVLGVRPEHLSPADDDAADAGITASVELTEPVGSEVYVTFRSEATEPGGVRAEGAGGLRVTTDGTLTCRVDEARVPDIGASVRLTAPIDRLHVFDAKSGVRLGGDVAAVPAAA